MYFDIGANVGNWSLLNVEKCDDRIIAVEASPITFNTLIYSCQHDKITLVNYAICNNDEKDISFYHATCDILSTINKELFTSEYSRFYKQPYTEMRCRTKSIDKLIQDYGMPELIKINIVGGEYECISSLTSKANLICFGWISETISTTFKCIDHLFKLGYKQFYIQYNDDYLFRPQDSQFYDISSIKTKLINTIIPKKDWGMIWCK